MTEIQIEREVTFDLPEGSYFATLTQLKSFSKLVSKGKQEWIRLLFEVKVTGMEKLDCRAGRNFLKSVKPGSELRNFLTPILTPDFFKQNSEQIVDLEALLVGRTGIIHLSHFTGLDYEKPMVIVDGFELEGKD